VLRAAALALAALAAGAAALGGAYPAAAAPGAWVPSGTPVTGAVSAAHAPALKAGATYTDTIARGQTRYYSVRLAAMPAAGDGSGGSSGDGVPGAKTAYLSAFAVPAPGSKVSLLDGISLRLASADGTLCDFYDAHFKGDDATAPVGGVVRRPGSTDEVCRAAGTYVLSVKRESDPASGSDVWPLDLRYMAEPALAAAPVQRPVPTYASRSPEPVGGPAQSVSGDAGMDGPGVRLDGDGVYRDRLDPGQTRYYRVPVDWGQRLFATADFGPATVTGSGGLVGSGLQVAVYSPARAFVDGQSYSYNGQSASVAVQTAEVDYDNRLSSDSRVNSAAVAGWYYLQVSLNPDVADFTRGGVGVTLRLRIGGTAQPGPHYRGSATAAGFGVSGLTPQGVRPSGTAGAAGPGAAAPGDPARRFVAYGAFALAAVFLVWPSALLLRGRRGRGARA
jgi:hypothetical protein